MELAQIKKLWDGQVQINRVRNGFIIYPLLGKSMLTEYMMIADSLEDISNKLEFLYEVLDGIGCAVSEAAKMEKEAILSMEAEIYESGDKGIQKD